MDEADLPAEHGSGFATEFWLPGHHFEKPLALQMQDFHFCDGDSRQAVLVPGERRRNSEERTGWENPVILLEVLDREANFPPCRESVRFGFLP